MRFLFGHGTVSQSLRSFLCEQSRLILQYEFEYNKRNKLTLFKVKQSLSDTLRYPSFLPLQVTLASGLDDLCLVFPISVPGGDPPFTHCVDLIS